MYPPRNPKVSIFEDEPKWKIYCIILGIFIIPILSAIPAIVFRGG